MKILPDHWLQAVFRDPIPGGSHMPTRRFLVIHYTEGWSGKSSIEFWKTREAQGASAHIVIDRDGTVTQCRPFDVTCGHAGVSRWTDPITDIAYNSLNSCSIGIELANSGTMRRMPDVFPKGLGKLTGTQIPRTVAKHKNGGAETAWETYLEAQLRALEIVAKAICERYNIDDLVGHDDIAPARKTDPGPAFSMSQLRAHCGFTRPLGAKTSDLL